MPTPCNIRYKHLQQLESEFVSLRDGGDETRLRELAKAIVELRREFNSTNAECEALLRAAHE